MNKSLHLAHWVLVAITVISLGVIANKTYALWQTNKINAFISGDAQAEQIPEHLKAQFAQAFNDAKQGKNESALEILTRVLESNDLELESAAYFNRANIHLRAAQALAADDSARISLLGLAKQDYRSALLINSSLWDARYNLELALLMAPEEPELVQSIKKGRNSSSVVVKAVGFRVDLP